MKGKVTIIRRGIPAYEFPIIGPIRAFAPPFGVLMGDINLPDYAFSSQPYAMYGVIHELGHVWDRRTSLELSRGLMVHMETLVCEGMGGCWFNIWAGRELPPGRIDEFKNYAATSPMEDWAESFASAVYPDYYNIKGYRVIGPLREQYVLDQIARLP